MSLASHPKPRSPASPKPIQHRPARPRQSRAAQSGPDFGSPFLCLLSFGEAKESKSPPGRDPARHKHQPISQRATESGYR
ncbi:hypothetical protein E5678_11080 [Hydrogenophaga sp. PAMC20947]|nr:hypothetical protein E5678_11080 [Hydrogenophaga sp. PAMC20947]